MTTVRELVFGNTAAIEVAERLPHDVSISLAVVDKVSESLNFEVGDVLVGAWRTRSALLEAARATKAQPGLVRRVTLASYAVPWDYQMRLDILLNGAPASTITIVLTLWIEVTALLATVQNGMLTHVGSGRYSLEAVLKAGGHELVRRQHELDLVHELRLGNGIPLITSAGAAA